MQKIGQMGWGLPPMFWSEPLHPHFKQSSCVCLQTDANVIDGANVINGVNVIVGALGEVIKVTLLENPYS